MSALATMETLIAKSPLQIKLNNNNVPEQAFDGESSSETADTVKTIGEDVKFNNAPLEYVVPEKKRKRNNNEAVIKKNLDREKYNEEIGEQRYKLLMHLLNKSKFYSDFIMKKIAKETATGAANKTRTRATRKDENTPPGKNISKKVKPGQKHRLRNYISVDLETKLRTDKLKLSDEEIGAELDNGFDESPEEPKLFSANEIPKYFKGQLFDHQEKGFHWLKVLYENGLNGILADEMGLGKTIQVIVLLCHLLEKRQPGPYLIVAPLSTLPNWVIEFEKFAPHLPVILLHAPAVERGPIYDKIRKQYSINNDFKTRPIVITSFDTPIRDKNILKKERWRYIIVDEGHRIKNHECQLIKVLQSFPSLNRLLLTGTPLHNNLAELWSLLNFLLPEIFDDLRAFKSWFDVTEMQQTDGAQKLLKQEEEKRVISSLREILKPFMLRREKSDVNLQISKKKELVVYAPLTELQYELYRAIINRDFEMLTKVQEEPTIIVDKDGKRPRRRCTLKHSYTNRDSDTRDTDSSSIDLNQDTSNDSMESDTWKNDKLVNHETIGLWKQYTNVTERNYEFFIRMSTGHRGILYKKVVNHPYLIHCPLGSDGLPKIDENLVKASGKLLVLDAMLKKLKQQGHKVLLFSTMTMILDIIEDFLSMRTYRYVRLDGRTKIEDRKEYIKLFNKDSNMFLFLISTRAGGVGLNLTGADTVIIYDSDWNPQMDIQAMARCHRIGQTRPVVIYRLCTRGTIDERIMTRANAKRVLEKAVIANKNQSLNINSLEILVELKDLLESKDYQIVTSENAVFSVEELNKLLDRSDLMHSSSDTE